MGKNMTPKKRQKAVDVGLPEGFKDEMRALLGEEAESLFEALCRDTEVSIRLNRRKPTCEPLFEEMEPVGWCRNGFYLPERPDFGHDPMLYAGAYYVQEASSTVYEQIAEKLVEKIIEQRGGNLSLNVLDLCAAPGGKSTAILNALGDDDLLVSNEYDRKRAWILKENIEKWGSGNVIVTNNEASDFSKLREKFDIIAVDAPCSGEGMMRREPVARSQWSENLVDKCSALQRRIVTDILPALKEGGYLIYSTCTFNRKENEENAEFFAKELGLEPVCLDLEGVEKAVKSLGGTALRFMPHKTRGEGLFVTVLRKGEACDACEPATKIREDRKKGETSGPATKIGEDRRKGGPDRRREDELQIGDQVYGVQDGVREMVKTLQTKGKNIRILSAGRPKAELKGKLKIPLSARVLVPGSEEEFPEVELTKEEALKYLRRENLTLPPDSPTGYLSVCYQGKPLGLVKNLGNRANNLYPTEWKIRN